MTTLREAHFCRTCEFRLPYCVRSDREFCGEQCRGWWYLHPGQKRLDFAPGEARPRRRLNCGQPKTLAEALRTLAEVRAHAAQLEAAARKQRTKEHQQRNNRSDLNDSLTESRARSRREKDALADEVETLRERLAELEQKAEATSGQEKELREQVTDLTAQLQKAAESEKELRRTHEELVEQREEEIEDLKSQHEEEIAELTTRHESELDEQLQRLTAAEAAMTELHEAANSLSQNLVAEQELRAAAEQRGDQLSEEIERLAREGPSTMSREEQLSLFESWDRHKSAELHDTRQHRDAAIAQRERYARRILRMMSPGQYLEHAMAAGHDVTQDPLFHDKRIEILVEGQVAEVQKLEKPQGRARELDTEQTLDEQAYAAAMAFRWQHINRPHRERRGKTKWIVVGFKLDQESEDYLRKLTKARTRRLEQSLGI